MTEKEDKILSDPGIVPTDDYIFSLIGDKKYLWQGIMKHMQENYNGTEGGWHYYNDGKKWLFKLVRKKKTIFWSCILEGTFRITFYFGDKAEPLIDNSNLPQKIKDDFKTSKRYGAIRAISIIVNDLSDVENVKELILIKTQLK